MVVGDRVMVIGSPLGHDFTAHEGAISNMSRPVLGVAYIQIDAKVNPGNSGGPVLDGQGRVIGVVTLKSEEGEGVGLALPVNYLYTGNEPFVVQPISAGETQGFEALLEKAKKSEQEVADAVRALDLRPGLLAATMDQYQRLVIHVGRIARFPPTFEAVSVKVWRGTRLLCTLQGDVSDWKRIERKEAKSSFDARSRDWLQRIGVDHELYVGESPLSWQICPREEMMPGIEIELEGADPEAARLRLQ